MSIYGPGELIDDYARKDSVPMLEKVARAIYYEAPGYGEWCDCPDNQREPYFSAARAALETLREPDEAMMTVGFVALHNLQGAGGTVPDIFTAMIDAILNPGTET